MAAIRELIRRYPVAAIAVVVGLAGLGGWTIYQSRLAQPPGVTVPPPQPPRAAAPRVTPTAPTGPAGAAPPAMTPTSPSGATPPETTGEGRPNPFEPLTPPPGATPAPGGATIPPVPPLPPAGPGQGTAPTGPEYRLVGVLLGDTALAILDDGQSTYVVGPGDTVTPGVRVLAIDMRRELVRLERDGAAVELTLSGTTRR